MTPTTGSSPDDPEQEPETVPLNASEDDAGATTEPERAGVTTPTESNDVEPFAPDDPEAI